MKTIFKTTLEKDSMEEKYEECGVVGIYSKLGKSVAPLLYRALVSLQHRGQDATGFAVYDKEEERIIERKGPGLAGSVFKDEDLELQGTIGVGHTRYPTIGSCSEGNVTPTVYDGIAVSHNGHIANYDVLKKELEKDYKFTSTVDSEPIAYYLHREKDVEKAVKTIMERAEGAFSDVAICHDKLIGFRDRFGIRPLVWGENEDFIMFASESVALDINNIEHKGDIHGGELVVVDNARLERVQIEKEDPHYCMFEYVYFSRPDSVINGRNVMLVRKLLGEELAKESPASADVVIPVPDTSRTAAMAYAKTINAEYDEGLIKNRYIMRTFIMPTQEKRRDAVKLKLNAVREIVEGKSVVLIDDSIVRGTTMKEIVQLVRNAGAKEVHVRITSPQIKAPCFYGVDMPTFKELIGNKKNTGEVEKYIGADSLAHLSLEGLKRAIGLPVCDACLTGKYHSEYVEKLAGAAK